MARQIQLELSAGLHDHYTEETARNLVGQEFDAKIEKRSVGTGKVVAAELAGDGGILVTLELPDEMEPLLEGLSDLAYGPSS